ncbi:hydantoinase B/oxoprolinase family protein [Starkeya sp. 3C]|uniref:Hydantoinase B/oxoprolinase family protein n=1 Tax=Ancylobacter moscoviensis TaxID=2597768 RepID=A0ABY3DMY4_9HYPH|nr:hydantoinase B/oxoprolinase family protein [Ancylobacter moscoviensis]TSJ60163.1 hydantoinase B/oxoprolinase family protein [Ancylobacter moscoviensis]
MTEINPIRRELLKNALVTIADNALVMVTRTARTANVKNSMDFSSAICTAAGALAAQGMAVPVHLGVVMPALKGCMDHFGADIAEGDVLASNDPYSGCSHLNDIFTFKPIHVDGRRVAFVSLVLHHTDLGGRVAGGNAADSQEIWEEGLRIPPVKLRDAGRENAAVFGIIASNSRVPDRVIGDLRAQLAALDEAGREVEAIARRMGADAFDAYLADLIRHAEELTRGAIAALPDGSVEFEEWNDDDGAGHGPIRLHCRLTKRGDEVEVDYSGTQDDTGGAVHCNWEFAVSCTYAALRTVLPEEVPNNAGLYRPIKVIGRPGSFVSVQYPAAVGSRGQIGFRLRSIVLGALARLLPGRMPACAGGSEFAIVASGVQKTAEGASRRFLHLEFHNNTGLGGGPDADGQDAGPYCIGNLANVPVELIESENPIRVERYAFIPDSGGDGQYRGALGLRRDYRFLTDGVRVQVRSDRYTSRPWGIFGGGPGAGGRLVANPGTAREEALSSKFIRGFGAGDVLSVTMAAAGGYGPAEQRDRAAIEADIRQGKMTPAHAARVYGYRAEASDPEQAA